jgi:hypothetical protein
MRTTGTTRALLLPLLLLSSACASRGTGGQQSADLLTAAQLADHHYVNAWEAVSALRPNWLHQRGQDSFNQPSEIQVYLDLVRLGTVEELRSVPIATIGYLRRFSGPQATARWGTGHSAGVILISTSRAEPER